MRRSTPNGADLHLHTVYSDGLCTPEALVAAARGTGLACIAVTDHDTTEGVEPARSAAGSDGPEVIAGVELATPSSDANEIHLVGLFVDPSCAELCEALNHYRTLREARAVRIVERLNRIGLPLRLPDVLSLAAHGCVGRLHVARALVSAGLAASVSVAFRKWLRPGLPGYVARERPSAEAAISLIHRSGGVAVMAHPGKTDLDDEIPTLVEAGLDAIELYCPEHSRKQKHHYRALAKRQGLLLSGGSDCHGLGKDTATLGRVRLDAEYVEALRERALQRIHKSA